MSSRSTGPKAKSPEPAYRLDYEPQHINAYLAEGRRLQSEALRHTLVAIFAAPARLLSYLVSRFRGSAALARR